MRGAELLGKGRIAQLSDGGQMAATGDDVDGTRRTATYGTYRPKMYAVNMAENMGTSTMTTKAPKTDLHHPSVCAKVCWDALANTLRTAHASICGAKPMPRALAGIAAAGSRRHSRRTARTTRGPCGALDSVEGKSSS